MFYKMPNKKKGRRSCRPNKEELFDLYEKYTAIEIAEMFDVSEATIRNWLSDYKRRNGVSKYLQSKVGENSNKD